MSVLEARRLTMADFEVLMQAVRLRKVDEQLMLHQQAVIDNNSKATVKRGKDKLVSKYKDFDDFYDYEEELMKAWGDNAPKRIMNKEDRESKFIELIKRANA